MNIELLNKIVLAITKLCYQHDNIYDYVSYPEIYQAISGIHNRDDISKHLDLLCDVDLLRYTNDGEDYYCPTSLTYVAALANDSNQLLEILQKSALQIKLNEEPTYDDEEENED